LNAGCGSGASKMGNRKILVVDDERDMRIYLSTIVETMGYEPLVAENGEQAVLGAQKTPPGLILLDIMMPKIEDGIRAYQRFKTDQQFSRIPIIVLSAIAQKTFLHAIRVLGPQIGYPLPGPQAYVEKPPDADELGRLIRNLLAP